MKLNETFTVEQYAHENFRVDVIEWDDKYEAWLYHKDYGIKSFMFGWPKQQVDGFYTKEQFIKLVEGNLDSHIAQS